VKIKYKLWVEGCTVKFQILEQVKLKNDFDYDSVTGLSVYSCSCPEISEGELFLRGSDETEDFKLCEQECDSPAEAHKLAAVIHETLEDWAKSLDEVSEEVDDVNVFVL